MRTYTQFASYFQKYLSIRHLDLTLLLKNANQSGEDFESHILSTLLKCHLFEVSDDIKRLLTLTNTPKDNDVVLLPFPAVFLDVHFKREEMLKFGVDIGFDEIFGILVAEGHMKLHTLDRLNEPIVGTTLRISICAIDTAGEKSVVFETYPENKTFAEPYDTFVREKKIEMVSEPGLNRTSRKFCKMFVLNFINFINNPEIQVINTIHDTKRDVRRICKGKMPLPNRSIIKLSGILKKYCDDLRANPNTWTYNYRFWVRGHFRTFRNPRYGTNVGSRVWLFPYIKGKGLLIEKIYRLNKLKESSEELC